MSGTDISRPTALIIASYTELAREFGRRLAQEGYGVHLSTDPMQALLKLESDQPSVILLARELLPTGGLMFLRVVRAHTDVKTVPTLGIGSADGLPSAILAEARELGLLDRLPSIGETWTVDRCGDARPNSPTRTHGDSSGGLPTIGPIAIVQTRNGSVPLSIEFAGNRRMDVVCGRGQLVAGENLRMVVREQIPYGDDVREVNLRILAEVSGVRSDADGARCSLDIAAASPPEDYEHFVRFMATR